MELEGAIQTEHQIAGKTFSIPAMLQIFKLWVGTLGSGYVTFAGVLIGPKITKFFLAGSKTITGERFYSSHVFSCALALGVQES